MWGGWRRWEEDRQPGGWAGMHSRMRQHDTATVPSDMNTAIGNKRDLQYRIDMEMIKDRTRATAVMSHNPIQIIKNRRQKREC